MSTVEDALERLAGMRRNVAASLHAVKGHLDTPYADDPRWTPWTRFIERELDRLYESRADLATVRGEIERLTEERDVWRTEAGQQITRSAAAEAENARLSSLLESTRAELKLAREGLREYLLDHNGVVADVCFCVHCESARALLAASSGSGDQSSPGDTEPDGGGAK